MNLKIFEGGTTKGVPVFLKLQDAGGGDIEVVVVDEDGDVQSQGHLVTFKTNGKIARASDVGEDFGFDLDGRERIKFEDEAGIDRMSGRGERKMLQRSDDELLEAVGLPYDTIDEAELLRTQR
jgi:hypothetical protein